MNTLVLELKKVEGKRSNQLIFDWSDFLTEKDLKSEYGSESYMRGGDRPHKQKVICKIEAARGWYLDYSDIRELLRYDGIKCRFLNGYVWLEEENK